MSRTTLTPADAAAIGRAIEEGAPGYLASEEQLTVALLVAHRLLTSQGDVVIESSVPEDAALQYIVLVVDETDVITAYGPWPKGEAEKLSAGLAQAFPHATVDTLPLLTRGRS